LLGILIYYLLLLINIQPALSCLVEKASQE